MSSQQNPLAVGARTMVAYEHASVEDAELLLVGSATIDVEASLFAGHAGDADLATRGAKNVGLDKASSRATMGSSPSSISSEGDGFISLAFWLEDSVVVLRCRRLIMDAVLDSRVDRVRTVLAPSTIGDSGASYGQESVTG